VEAALTPVLRQLGKKPTPEQILSLKICDPAMGSGAFLVEACRQLGDALAQSWHDHDAVPVLPPDEDEVLHAQRQIAQRCLYGVDKNPLAAHLAKLSLWLATLAKDHPFTFLDHSLRAGDTLAGLTRRQIAAFNWLPTGQQSFLEDEIRKRIDRVSEFRQRIMAARDDVPYSLLRQHLDRAEDAMLLLRLVGDAVLAAFFSADKTKPREDARKLLQQQMEAALKNLGKLELAEPIESAVAGLRRGAKGVTPFHWELEFPEVFAVDAKGNVTGGFDAIVGNPPFLGGTRISAEQGMRYFAWLTETYPPAGHLCDLVAYFFRRAYQCLRDGGCFGLIATNTVAQGDTREGGLAEILTKGGQIYSAIRRLRWPGQAVVVVSIVHVSKNAEVSPVSLDREPVSRISAFLLRGAVDLSPKKLRNVPYFSSGTKIYGQGFLFDDNDANENPLAVRSRVLEQEPASASRILPYIGGEEVNSSPSQTPHRYVIYLSDIKDEVDLTDWPTLAEIVRAKVKPERDRLGNNPNNIPLKRRWWAYQAHRPELYSRIGRLSRVLVNSQTSSHLAFTFLPTGWIYSQKLNVFEIDGYSGFAILQSRVHEIWARTFASSMKDDLCYTPSDCYETFPFPPSSELEITLEKIGGFYFNQRAEIMQQRNYGLTAAYNDFHNPESESLGITNFRELQDRMDRAVLDAYGWSDVQPWCEFIPEFDDEEDEDENGRPRRKKYRYRWPDEVRDDVLARLLELNRQRALEEGQLPSDAPVFAGMSDPEPKKKGNKKKAGNRATEDLNLNLLPQEKEEA
jgi:hypothetical protein